MEEDAKKIQIQDNRNHIIEVLSANDLDCDDLSSICQADTMVLSNYIDEIIVSAVSYHLVHNKDPEYKNGKLLLSSKRFDHLFILKVAPIIFLLIFFKKITSQLIPWIKHFSRKWHWWGGHPQNGSKWGIKGISYCINT
jgi:hypothetical protein